MTKRYCGGIEIATFQLVIKLFTIYEEKMDVINKAKILLQDKKFDEVIMKLNSLSESMQKRNDVLTLRGISFWGLKRYQDAVLEFTRCISNDPHNAETYNNLASVLRDSGDIIAAKGAFLTAIKLDPQYSAAYTNLGTVYSNEGDYKAALEYLLTAIKLKSDFYQAFCEIGNINFKRRRYVQAKEYYEKSISINKNYFRPYTNLSSVYYELGEINKAIEIAQKSLDQNPDNLTVASNYFFFKKKICSISLSKKEKDLYQMVLNAENCAGVFGLLCSGDDPEIELKRARAYSKNKRNSSLDLSKYHFHKNNRKRLKIGFFSADFKRHPVMHLLMPILENLDKSFIEVFCYSWSEPNPYSKKVSDLSCHFFDVQDLSDAEICLMARNHELDIAFDLTGYTTGSRPRIFASRVANTQINYLGFPGTMGSNAYDYILADEFLIPDESADYYHESIIHMPICYQVGPSNKKETILPMSKSEAGLPKDKFIFCSLNNGYKIGECEINAWSKILKRSYNSVLWLYVQSSWQLDNLITEFSKRGISKKQLLVFSKVDYSEYLNKVACADLFLDSFFYSSGATANDVVSSGVPILAFPGKTYSSRMSGSINNCLHLNHLNAQSIEEYIELAVKISMDFEFKSKINAKLTEGINKSGLFNEKKFAHDFEKVLFKIKDLRDRSITKKIVKI